MAACPMLPSTLHAVSILRFSTLHSTIHMCRHRRYTSTLAGCGAQARPVGWRNSCIAADRLSVRCSHGTPFRDHTLSCMYPVSASILFSSTKVTCSQLEHSSTKH